MIRSDTSQVPTPRTAVTRTRARSTSTLRAVASAPAPRYDCSSLFGVLVVTAILHHLSRPCGSRARPTRPALHPAPRVNPAPHTPRPPRIHGRRPVARRDLRRPSPAHLLAAVPLNRSLDRTARRRPTGASRAGWRSLAHHAMPRRRAAAVAVVWRRRRGGGAGAAAAPPPTFAEYQRAPRYARSRRAETPFRDDITRGRALALHVAPRRPCRGGDRAVAVAARTSHRSSECPMPHAPLSSQRQGRKREKSSSSSSARAANSNSKARSAPPCSPNSNSNELELEKNRNLNKRGDGESIELELELMDSELFYRGMATTTFRKTPRE